ncbi:MAG: YkgJ family cysteine cluster protein [Planctomycetota bacterium]
MSPQCAQCDGRCCRYVCLEIDTPTTYEEYENIRWYVAHRDVSVHIDDGDWYFSVLTPCEMQDDEGRCTIYQNRPKICRTYSSDGCDASGGDYDYEEVFAAPEQVERYARKALGAAAFYRARARARDKPPARKRKQTGRRGRKAE